MKTQNKIVCSVMAIIALVTGSAVPNYAPTESPHPTQAVGVVRIGDFEGELLVSPDALKVIGNAEGCMRTPYTCPAGLSTDGIGNTHGVTREIKSDEQIAIDWTKNIIAAQNCLASSGDVASMSQGQIDAFTSFIFNTGCTRFKHNRDGSETRIFKKIRAKHFYAACDEFKYWVYAGGQKLPGLVTRRADEREMCFAE
ncbi:lysozyme [Vibrio owensii]|uniref:lysozyme n=1 Tax=Vibrio owensii TaxID=696485 RepID=UPI001047B5BA|nr:lysozyme [Vibrio owensii]TDE19273.1 lysozyme [Vibrio owensii]